MTDCALPAYRFVPGRTPHPVLDPAGHSYGRAEPDLASEAGALPADFRASHHFCYSVDLYNHAYWWEAHEGWEGLWHQFEAGDPLRHTLQALVQVSAAHLVRFMGQPRGVESLLGHARRHLDRAEGGARIRFGLDVEAWWSGAVIPYFGSPENARFPFLEPHQP